MDPNPPRGPDDVSDLERFFDGLDAFRQKHGTTSLHSYTR